MRSGQEGQPILKRRDIKGKVFGVPVWELLGGKVREACPVYGWVGGDRPSDVLAQAKVRKEQGFTRVKMNVCHFLHNRYIYQEDQMGKRLTGRLRNRSRG